MSSQVEPQEILKDLGDPIFECECDEPEGIVKRKVYLAKFTREFLFAMWEKQRKYKTLMGKEIAHFEQFLDFFIHQDKTGAIEPKGLCFVIDDLAGIFWLSDIHYPAYAEVHYTFFDGRHKGRLNLVRAGIKYAFDKWQFNRLYVRVALYAKLPIRFVESLGFIKEGRLRQCVQYNNVWWDVNCYSLLKDEVKKYVDTGKWS